MEPADENPLTIETPGAEFYDKILAAFDLFDNEGNKTVERSEIGTIMCWLGCAPTEAEIAAAIQELEQKDSPGVISFKRFLPYMTQILVENQYQLSSKEQLLKAFKALDTENASFLTLDQVTKYMTEEGEPLSNEELEEMLSAACSEEDNNIHYKDYVSLLLQTN